MASRVLRPGARAKPGLARRPVSRLKAGVTRTLILFLAALLCAGSIAASAAPAKEALGVFERWGAFRDAEEGRCYAIAAPVRETVKRPWKPFASVGFWPRQHVRGQVQLRLSRQKAKDARVILTIGPRRFALVGGGADAWAPDPRVDAAIVSAMRSDSSMRVASVDEKGNGFSDLYALRGAATAIDAATIGCSRL